MTMTVVRKTVRLSRQPLYDIIYKMQKEQKLVSRENYSLHCHHVFSPKVL